MRATCSSMTAAGVQVGGVPATSYRKFFRISCPCGVCTTSGWNWTPYRRRARSSKAAIGVDGELAVTSAPVGGAVTESRWLIHTVCSGGRSWKSSDSAALELGLSELGRARALDRAAEVARHELHAVADAERRDPELEDPRVEIGRALCVHRRRPAGEDQRGRVARRDLGGGQPVPDELRVHARLAHAPRDQLAVLAAEVDDEDGTLLGRGLGGRERDDLGHQRR